MAQSGPVHTYLINQDGVNHIHDPLLSGQGLGFGKSNPIRFFHSPIKEGDIILLAAMPAPSWDERLLQNMAGQGPETIRRRLFDRNVQNLSGVLIHTRPGSGKVQIVSAAVQIAAPPAKPIEVINAPGTLPAMPEEPVRSSRDTMGEATPPIPVAEQEVSIPTDSAAVAQDGPSPQAQPISSAVPIGVKPVTISPSVDQPVEPPVEQTLSSTREKSGFLLGLIAVGDRIGEAFSHFWQASGKFLARFYPEEILEIPSAVMAFIAIAVPVIIVTAASFIYFQLGRAAQGRQFFLQAGEAAVQAISSQTAEDQRTNLVMAMDYLAKAEEFGGVPAYQVDELRARLRSEFDSLDNVRRVDYRLALLDNLAPAVKITRIIPVFDDLYFLDSTTGSVLRAQFTSEGYLIDPDFNCDPARYSAEIGPLVSIASWPAGFLPQATILGMDAVGRLIYCQPDLPPEFGILTSPAYVDFKQLTGMTIDRGNVYVLDPSSKAVWLYLNVNFKEEPYFFFGDQVPRLDDVVDMAANFNEIYLLHSDGSLTLCFTNLLGGAVSSCIDPQPYMDFRSGGEITYTPLYTYSQITSNPSPDPSLYLLDPVGQSINHYSFRTMGLLQIYSPQDEFTGETATAFSVDGLDRILFLAFNNRLYYAPLP
jgi:hypothetical protein